MLLNSYKITLFYVISSDTQELVHHTHCLGYVFYHQSMMKNFVDLIGSYSIILTLDTTH